MEVLLVTERHPATAEGTALHSCSAAAEALGAAVSRNPRAPHGNFECRGLASVDETVALLGRPDAHLETLPTAPM